MYLTTNTNTYNVNILEDGKLEITDLRGKAVKNAGLLIANLGGIEAVKARLTAEMPKQDTAERDFREVAKALVIAEARRIIENAESSAADLLKAAKVFSKTYGMSSELDKIFRGENALSQALLAFGGSYTFTTYEHGETVVKFDNGERFSTFDRNSKIKNARYIREIVEG